MGNNICNAEATALYFFIPCGTASCGSAPLHTQRLPENVSVVSDQIATGTINIDQLQHTMSFSGMAFL